LIPRSPADTLPIFHAQTHPLSGIRGPGQTEEGADAHG
jgi:hypothetical protein